MIKVILNGCSGRMGSVLTDLIAITNDMEVVAGIDVIKTDRAYPIFDSLVACTVSADVIIDFSSAASLVTYLPTAIERKLPAVVATTGLTVAELNLLDQAAHKIAIFRSGNMSLGINLVQQLLQSTTQVLGDNWDVEIVEKHHHFKKDAPSGTALMLAHSIKEVSKKPLYNVCGREGGDVLRQGDEIGIHSLRGGTIVGEHEVFFAGEDEVISIGHQAFSRKVFATGAIAAARYLVRQKQGLFTMQEMINETQAGPALSVSHYEVLISVTNIGADSTIISHLYSAFDQNDISPDMINQIHASETLWTLSCTIKEKHRQTVEYLLTQICTDYPEVCFRIEDKITKLTFSVDQQKEVASRLLSCMAQEKIPIVALSTLANTISCLVSTDLADRAIQIVNTEFKLG